MTAKRLIGFLLGLLLGLPPVVNAAPTGFDAAAEPAYDENRPLFTIHRKHLCYDLPEPMDSMSK